MKSFKQFISEDHVAKLEKGLKKLDSHSYETINKLMMSISKDHNISGEELHNDFKSKHGKTPDDWIKEFNEGAVLRKNSKNAPIWQKNNFWRESTKENNLKEDLRKWFKQKWVRMDTKGNIKGDCAREPGEGKPKCLPQAKAHAIGKDARASAAQRKRREDPNPERRGAPINVKTESMDNKQ
jgi:hypothetical protein